jgi:hypothetical protein
MTLAAASYLTTLGNTRLAWGTELYASDSTQKEILGSVRWDVNPIWGLRGFEYVRFHFAAELGQLCTQVANVAIANQTGTVKTGFTLTGSMTADIYVGCLARVKDDAGAAGAAPEGELARIISNTANAAVFHPDDELSAALASGDDLEIICPNRVKVAAAGEESLLVRGVAMAAQTAYYYGWVQFYGRAPHAQFVAAGTAVTGPKGLIAATGGLLTVSNSSSRSILVASLETTTVATDQVKRTDLAFMHCGVAGEPLISA